MSLARWAAALVVAVVPLAFTAAAASAADAAAVPDPCTVVSPFTVSTSIGLELSLAGKLSTRSEGTVKAQVCTFTHAGATLEITLAPHVPSGGYGGPPGSVFSKPSGLGSEAHYAYDNEPKYAYASADFTKGDIDGSVWDNGKFANAGILTLARAVYKALS